MQHGTDRTGVTIREAPSLRRTGAGGSVHPAPAPAPAPAPPAPAPASCPLLTPVPQEQQPRGGGAMEGDEWGYRGYTRMRGSREAVTGAKSTCSGNVTMLMLTIITFPCKYLVGFCRRDNCISADVTIVFLQT